MNRYKLNREDFPAAVKYIQGNAKKGESPNWAVKFKADLTVHDGGKTIKYKGLKIIPESEVDAFLRKTMFDKKSDVGFGRDSAHHVLKQRVVGVPRRKIMEFFRKQRVLGEVRPAVAGPKKFGGIKLKGFTFETDLIFVKASDIKKSNRRFSEMPNLSYIVSTVEKTTGLSRYSYSETKQPSVVTPLVIKHIKEMAKKLGADLKKCSARFDKGKEFDVAKIKAVIPDTQHVSMGGAVERRNRFCQATLFKLIKTRRVLNIEDALKSTQILVNQSYNRIQKATPNENAEKAKTDQKSVLKKFNDTRNIYEQGDNRKEFQKDDYVRVLVKKPKAGIDYKTYKNVTWTERVFKISKRTKGKRRDQPIKYRVNGRWYTIDKLLKSAPRDQESEAVIADLDKKQDAADKRADEEYRAREKKKATEADVRREAEVQAGTRRRTRRGAREKQRVLLKKQREESEALDRYLDDIDEEERVKKTRRRRVTIKHKGKTIMKV